MLSNHRKIYYTIMTIYIKVMYLSFKSRIYLTVLGMIVLSTAVMAEETGLQSVNIAANSTLGTYLVNQTSFTLYYLTKDIPGNGSSSCYGECSALWPPFYAENLTVAQGLETTDFTVIDRTDGNKQIAYTGWPLYLYSRDKKPKEAAGEGINKIWFVVNPASTPFSSPEPADFWQSKPSGSSYFPNC
jgi:predicted lipoprotein with Yx(FWY)xxD motif